MYTLTEPTTTTTNDDDGLILAIKYFRLLPNLCSPTQDKHNRREDNLNSALVTRRCMSIMHIVQGVQRQLATRIECIDDHDCRCVCVCVCLKVYNNSTESALLPTPSFDKVYHSIAGVICCLSSTFPHSQPIHENNIVKTKYPTTQDGKQSSASSLVQLICS